VRDAAGAAIAPSEGKAPKCVQAIFAFSFRCICARTQGLELRCDLALAHLKAAPAQKSIRAHLDATTLLVNDHKDVKTSEQICRMLTVHATIPTTPG
jgi:hypothetical protein